MPSSRILIADRDVRMRQGLAAAIEAAGGEVVAVTHSLETAVGRLEHTAADILVIDADLVDVSTLPHLRKILAQWGELVVVVQESADRKTSLANDLDPRDRHRCTCLRKTGDLQAGIRLVVQSIGRAGIRQHVPAPEIPRQASDSVRIHESVRPAAASRRIDAIVVAVSTGGPNALAEVIPHLPVVLPAPVLIVQHMPADFVGPLAERLTSLGGPVVKVAADGQTIGRHTCVIAPGGKHLEVRPSGASVVATLTDTPPENSCKPAADVLFRSAAKVFGPNVLGVVLTGMGRDGLAGSRRIVEAGGSVIVQDEKSSVVWGMPGVVAEEGLAEKIVPLDKIAAEIVARCKLS